MLIVCRLDLLDSCGSYGALGLCHFNNACLTLGLLLSFLLPGINDHTSQSEDIHN